MLQLVGLIVPDLWNRTKQLLREEDGATAVEYGLLVALIAAAIIFAVTVLGQQIESIFCNVVGALGGDEAECLAD